MVNGSKVRGVVVLGSNKARVVVKLLGVDSVEYNKSIEVAEVVKPINCFSRHDLSEA